MLSDLSLISDATLSDPSMTPRSSDQEQSLDDHDRDEEKSQANRLGSLVLTRHLSESIMIGDEVEVQVVGIKSGIARLKIMAPRTIAVHRREIFDSIRQEPSSIKAATVDEPVNARPGKPQGGLVLARSVRQSIMIGEDVEIAVVEIRPSTVKLKITAPRSIAVHRLEIFKSLRDFQG